MNSPITYFGGKSKLSKKFIEFIPRHKTFVEVFGGSGSFLFAKKPSEIEVYNDIDKRLYVFFKVIKDPIKFSLFEKLASLTPYSREEFFYNMSFEGANDLDIAYNFWILNKQTFSGKTGEAWSYSVTTGHEIAENVSRYINSILKFPSIHNRLKNVIIENEDFRKLIPKYDTEDTFFYLDPPYLHETRRSGWYKYEMGDEDHKDLLELILTLKGKVMISGYNNSFYDKYLHNWKRIDFKTVCTATGGVRGSKLTGVGILKLKQQRIESIWLNYDIPSTIINLEKVI